MIDEAIDEAIDQSIGRLWDAAALANVLPPLKFSR